MRTRPTSAATRILAAGLLLAFGALIRRHSDSGWMWAALLTGLFAIAAAVNLRAGHVQITYYVVVIAAIWWVAEGIADWREGTLKDYGLSTLLLVIGSALALAMVAHPYLAQWEYKAFTIRSSGAGGGHCLIGSLPAVVVSPVPAQDGFPRAGKAPHRYNYIDIGTAHHKNPREG